MLLRDLKAKKLQRIIFGCLILFVFYVINLYAGIAVAAMLHASCGMLNINF